MGRRKDENMALRIVWVHGIGIHKPGYSKPWEKVFTPYFHLPHQDYVEVCWDTVFTTPLEAVRGPGSVETIELTPDEVVAEERIREDILATLSARNITDSAKPARRGSARAEAPAGNEVIEWPRQPAAANGKRGLLPNWLTQPDEYLGDFVKYLASLRVRAAIKEKCKQQLRALANDQYDTSVISHSWGTVVAYESLLDLELEAPTLKVANLFTLGSPLWLVRHLLVDQSGRKSQQTRRWVNIHARGDLVGSWLSPNFRVDRDFQVPSVGNDAHGSYFVVGNSAVQNDLIARNVLEDERR
jgi:metacaspase-1